MGTTTIKFPLATDDSTIQDASGVVSLKLRTFTYNVPLTAIGKDDLISALPDAGDGTNPGLVAGTHGSASPSIQGSDGKAASGVTETCRFLLPIPTNYVSGDLTLRIHGGMLTTISDQSATVDVQVYESDLEAGVGSDLCETAAQSINNTTLANDDFTIDGDGLSGGDILDIEITLFSDDDATGTVVMPIIGAIQLIYTGY